MRALIALLAAALVAAAPPRPQCAQRLITAVRSPADPAAITTLVSLHSRIDDSALVLAVIAAESAFNPAARSPANAVGLMQVTDLARQDAELYCKLAPVSMVLLYDPAVNITYGTCYLRQALAHTGSEQGALHMYHGGYRQWENWRAGRPVHPDTTVYVNRVLTLKATYCGKV